MRGAGEGGGGEGEVGGEGDTTCVVLGMAIRIGRYYPVGVGSLR